MNIKKILKEPKTKKVLKIYLITFLLFNIVLSTLGTFRLYSIFTETNLKLNSLISYLSKDKSICEKSSITIRDVLKEKDNIELISNYNHPIAEAHFIKKMRLRFYYMEDENQDNLICIPNASAIYLTQNSFQYIKSIKNSSEISFKKVIKEKNTKELILKLIKFNLYILLALIWIIFIVNAKLIGSMIRNKEE